MNTNLDRAGSTLERYLPVILAVVIVAVAYVRFIQPNVAEYVRLRGDVQTLDSRVRTLTESTARGRAQEPVDEAPGLRAFERRVPTTDNTVEVVEKIVRAALDGVPADRVRNLSVQTGERVAVQTPGAGGPAVQQGNGENRPDPRLAMFGAALDYAPVTIGFESSFEVIGEFMWRLRDMPTLVEVRSVKLTRGLPLMKVELTAFVYRRTSDAVGSQPGRPSAPSTLPGVPRVAALMGVEGVSR